MMLHTDARAMIEIYRAAMYDIVSISLNSRLSPEQYHEIIKELEAVLELFKKHRDNPIRR